MKTLASAENELLLGIILRDGTVELAKADPSYLPDHRSWIMKESLGEVNRGFSLIIKAGTVSSMFLNSELNLPENGFELEKPLVKQLRRLIPQDRRCRIFSHDQGE